MNKRSEQSKQETAAEIQKQRKYALGCAGFTTIVIIGVLSLFYYFFDVSSTFGVSFASISLRLLIKSSS